MTIARTGSPAGRQPSGTPSSGFLSRALLACALAAALIAACSGKPEPFVCSDKLGCVDLGPDDPVKIGVIQALSGKVASLGQEQVRGLELALAKRGGLVAGRTVDLPTEDTGCRPEGGANTALKLVADPAVLAIFGTTCSGDAATASMVMSEAGLSMISGNNSAPFLTSVAGRRAPKWQPGYFRTAPNEEASGPAAATYAFKTLGIRQAATVNDGDIYTSGLTEGFKQEFERLGGRITLSATVNKSDTNMAPVLTGAVNSGAQLLFFPLFQPEGNHVLRQARQMPEMKNIALMSDGSLIEATFLADVQQDALGMYFVGPTPPDLTPEVAALRQAYIERYKMDPPTMYYQSAYDAANILFDAIEKVAKRDSKGTLHVGRQALRDALYATAGFRGVTGTLGCNEFGDCAPPRFNVLRLDDLSKGVDGLRANVLFTYAPGNAR
ncbi:branched-chain amino acid ABC transporter substrate-binding protein [Fundidesulfovibrio agrisoli]|uniref:branched-chain amino acid ABC transporter substrate-binding protein n=1 Tax=Fundidesulfovibrio agrisoli TaxID=2922717 RepID=UPI001FACAE43|nr:branched-chain amino acid ABC transporter substrate-binding protein [Fundidesulfovibrio agrisoli]